MIKYLLVFIFGGLLSGIAQILIDKTKLTPARILVSYVVIGAILGAIGVYKYFLEIFNCGASIPIMGFGYSLVKGVAKSINEYGPIGILTGGLTGTSGGIAAVIVFSLIISLFFKGKPEKL